MNVLLGTLCAMAALVGTVPVVMSQDAHVVLQVIDGRSGKPLANQRLLVFAGKSEGDVRRQKQEFELISGKNGMADLRIALPEFRRIQMWVDFHILCQSEPNARSFSIAEILSTGVSAPNTCGSLRVQPRRGELIVFARPAHLWEKMRR